MKTFMVKLEVVHWAYIYMTMPSVRAVEGKMKQNKT
jgi:hypothetical protein